MYAEGGRPIKGCVVVVAVGDGFHGVLCCRVPPQRRGGGGGGDGRVGCSGGRKARSGELVRSPARQMRRGVTRGSRRGGDLSRRPGRKRSYGVAVRVSRAGANLFRLPVEQPSDPPCRRPPV
jgi:hypothetical protein